MKQYKIDEYPEPLEIQHIRVPYRGLQVTKQTGYDGENFLALLTVYDSHATSRESMALQTPQVLELIDYLYSLIPPETEG